MTTTKEKTDEETTFYTCKTDAMFKTVFIDEENPQLLEAVLSCILGGQPHIISWPTTFISKDTAKEKSKTRDLVVELDGKYINLEVETGKGKETKCKLFTYFVSMWKKNILRGDKYDTKTLFLQIVLQYGLSSEDELFKNYQMQHVNEVTKETDVWIENFTTLVANMERFKKMWYDGYKEELRGTNI